MLDIPEEMVKADREIFGVEKPEKVQPAEESDSSSSESENDGISTSEN